MDLEENRFERLTRALTAIPSRRDVLRGLAGVGLELGFARLPDLVEAKKKRKRKKRKKKSVKPQPNEFGCLEVGDPCGSEADCCSGICAGSKGKKTCRAHGTGSCPQDRVGICLASAADVPFLKCGNSDTCFCYTTTAGSSFCGDRVPVVGDGESCADCQTDADCLALGFPAGSACAPVGIGYCSGQCESGMACLSPCGSRPS